MRLVPETEKGVALAAGAVTLSLFPVVLVLVHVATPVAFGRRELAGFAVGFAIFVGIYFASMSADRVLRGDDRS